jgi:hypothetical protein
MAKLFYTLDEAAAKLGQTADEVRQLASTGRIQEFRDRDKLMFKVDQIDLLAASLGGDDSDEADMSSMIPLADSAMGDLGLAGSTPGLSSPGLSKAESMGGDKIDLLAESAPGLSGSPAKSGTRSGLNINESSKAKSKSGVSIFDADDLERAESGAITPMSSGSGLDDLSLEPVGSGSGLMELTRESDDTSLGAAEFLQEVGDDTTPELPAGASGLFRAQPEEPEAMAAPAALVAAAAAAAEPFDGPGSGLTGGLCVGAVVALAIGVAVALVSMTSGVEGGEGLTGALASNFMAVVGAMAGVTVVGGALGFFLGKRA